MDIEKLTDDEFQLIKESLNYYKRNIAEYKDYPSYEFKQKQLQRVDVLLAKLKS